MFYKDATELWQTVDTARTRWNGWDVGEKTSCRPPLTPIKLGNNSSSLLMEMATINIRGGFHFVVDHSSPQE